jgi:hypothetical protein
VSLRGIILVTCLLVLPATAGCRFRPYWLVPAQPDLPPEAFADKPGLEDIVYVVNANTQRVQRLQTENASLRVDGIPAMRANLAFEQPANFRLLAQLSQFTGRELDLGSNQDVFWFWVRRDTQRSVYFARHEMFANSPTRDLIPIEPNRLIDTLGLVYLEPAGQHSGPVDRADGLLEITTRIPSAQGEMTRVMLIDAKYGWPAQQHLYDAGGQLLLSTRASQQRFYREESVTLPHRIEVTLMPGQPSQLAFDLDVAQYSINRLAGDGTELWTMPQMEGYPAVDIADPQFRPPVAGGPVTGPPQAGPYPRPAGWAPSVNDYSAPRTANLPDYRGYESPRRY